MLHKHTHKTLELLPLPSACCRDTFSVGYLGERWFNLQGKQELAHLCAKLQETRSVYTDRKYPRIKALTWLDAAHPVWS